MPTSPGKSQSYLVLTRGQYDESVPDVSIDKKVDQEYDCRQSTCEESDMSNLSPLLQQATGVTAERGEGLYIVDVEGRRYLDFTAGIGVTSTGHCHPHVVDAIREQAGKLIHGQYTTVLHRPLELLAERLSAVSPDHLNSVFFANSGSEAVEAALRLARHATGRPNIIAFHGGFHGRTMGAAALTTSKVAIRAGLQPLMGGVVVAPFPHASRYGWSEEEAVRFCLDELDYLFATVTDPRETAALIIEPVLGEGGYVPTPAAFAVGLKERCERFGMLFIADEVQTGVGRTGRFWGHEHLGVEPDIMIVAKGLASGMPLSAMVAPKELMERAWTGSQGGTYGGNALSCAAALATLDVIEQESLVANADVQGTEMLKGLRVLAAGNPRIGGVRGLGLMLAVEVVDTDGNPDAKATKQLQAGAVGEGLLLLTCGAYGNVVRFIPPLIVQSAEIKDGLERFGRALQQI